MNWIFAFMWCALSAWWISIAVQDTNPRLRYRAIIIAVLTFVLAVKNFLDALG